MNIKTTPFKEVFILKPTLHLDERGSFMESFNKKEIEKVLNRKIVFCQDNQTFSKKGVHQTTVWIDANFMNNGYFLIGVGITTFAPFQVHVADYDAIAFEVLDNLQSHARQGYAGKIDGYVRPVFDWTNKNGTTNDI